MTFAAVAVDPIIILIVIRLLIGAYAVLATPERARPKHENMVV
jgi:hypothetical protein